MNYRLELLRNRMANLNLQGMIVSNPINIKYLTNIEAEGILLVTPKENVYITDGRYIQYARSVITLFDEIIIYDIKEVSEFDYENFFESCENVGFEENDLKYAEYKKFLRKYRISNFVETEYIVEKLRMIKDEDEIESIKKACSITDECFNYLQDFIKPGMTEKQISKEIKNYFEEKADGEAFDTIVASGENSSKPHAVPSDRIIQENDIIIIDMGCKVNGYCSDMTRTIFVGEPTEKMKMVYEIVLKNQHNIESQIKEGANTRQLTKILENNFKVNGHELIHALGHGVGLEIHELPYVSCNCDMFLKENMTITNEPGIYIMGEFGVRIEDTLQITKSGCINLTISDKNIIRI